MDTSVLTTLLEAQDKAYRGAMELFTRQLTDQCKKLQTTVLELRTSLEFSQKEVDDLKLQVHDLNQDRINDKATVLLLSEDLQASHKLQNRCNYQEDYNRRNNLEFIGLQEDPVETWEQSAQKVHHLLENRL